MKKTYFALPAIIVLAAFNTAIGQAPVISSVSPLTGPVGSAVTITGTGFNSTNTNNIVFFGGVKAAVATASATQLQVTVPVGAAYNHITALNTATGLTAASTLPFSVTFSSNLETPPPVDIPIDYTIGGTGVSDIDGDGMLDIVNLDFSLSQVRIHRNTTVPGSSTLTFANKVSFYAIQNPNDLTIGDINGDGKPDIVVTYSSSRRLLVLRNTSTSGALSFAPAVMLNTPTTSSAFRINEVSIGDIDGDGKPDLAIAHMANLGFLRNLSSGTNIAFAPEVIRPVGEAFYAIKLADLDGDQKLDVITANVINNTIYVARNTATPGSIGASSFAAPQIAGKYHADEIKTADFDGDGKLDLLIEDHILRNTSTGSSISFTGQTIKDGFAVADIDGDGKPDMAGYGPDLIVYKNTSAGSNITFVSKQINAKANGLLADINGDGKTDVVSGSRILLNNPEIPQKPVISSFSPLSGTVGSTVTISGSLFNTVAGNNIVYFGAGKAEVITASATQLTVKVPKGATLEPITVLNTSIHRLGFSTKPFNVTYNQPKAIISQADFETRANLPVVLTSLPCVKDLNDDGKPDVLVGDGETLSIFKNQSVSGAITAASFASKRTVPIEINGQLTVVTAVTVYDIDNDGKQDIMVGGRAKVSDRNQYLSIFRNISNQGDTDPTFAAPVHILVGESDYTSGVSSIFAADVDADGRAEVVLLTGDGGQITTLQNLTTPGVINASSFAVKNKGRGYTPPPPGSMLQVADVDEDGKPDFIVTSRSDRTVNIRRDVDVLYNRSVPGATGLEQFEYKTFPVSDNPNALTMGDIDGNGKLDILVASYSPNKLTILGNNSVSGNVLFNKIADINIAMDMLTAADINGDGKIDLFNGNGNGVNAKVITNNYSPGHLSYAAEDMGIRLYSTSFIDIDGDGLSDLVGSDNGNVIIMRYSPQQSSLRVAATDINANTAVSPNGDGVNDVFTINGIEKYPDNKVVITNSRGITVFEAVGYNNTSKAFDGISTTGIRQEAGTYFYTIVYTDNGMKKNKTGFIVLKY